MLTVDLETTGLDPHTDRVLGYGINDLFETDREWASHLLKGKGITCHNGSFDVKFLWANGVEGVHVEFDTMIAAYLLKDRPESLSLKACAAHYLGVSGDWKDVDLKTIDFDGLKRYCLEDVRITSQLRIELTKRLEAEGLMHFFRKLMAVRHELTRAEYKGFNINWGALINLSQTLNTKVETIYETITAQNQELIKKWQKEEIEKKLSKLKRPEAARGRLEQNPPAFNWASPKQVLWALKRQGADVVKYDFFKKEWRESSDSDVLSKNVSKAPFAKPLLEAREAAKTLGMLEGYLEGRNKKTDRLHGNFNITATATGRLSSSSPNLQNIDRGPTVRGLFIPSPGKVFIIGDLAQIEVRMAAHYSQDPVLVRMFKEGEDFYGTIAKNVLGTPCSANEVKTKFPNDRAVAKVIGLSILYGTGAKRLQQAIEQGAGQRYSEEDCRDIINQYFRRFEGLKILQKRVEAAILDKGHLRNLFGRRVNVDPADIYMRGVNYLLQSSASDLMIFRQLEMSNKSDLIALVHDELIRECTPDDAQAVIQEAKTALERVDDIKFRVPLKLDVKACMSWAEKG